MASIKVKFRPSTLSNKEGTVYYQITHRRTIRQLKPRINFLPKNGTQKPAKQSSQPTLGTTCYCLSTIAYSGM